MTLDVKAKIQTHCWIITLNPSSESVRRLLTDLAAQGVTAEVIAGVDGRKGMPSLQPGERLARAKMRWRHLCELNASEVGCYLAHLRALRRAHEAGVDRICILEDDVELEPAFATVIAELEQLPEDVEMIRLMALKVRKRKIVKTLADGVHQLVRPERGCLGTQGYLINRAGMEKVLRHGSTIFEPIDKLYDHFWEYGLRVFGVEPHVLWEIAGTSAVIKSNVARARVAPWLYWFYPVGKFFRSVRRHWHLRRHRDQFYPAEKPGSRPGQTERMKL